MCGADGEPVRLWWKASGFRYRTLLAPRDTMNGRDRYPGAMLHYLTPKLNAFWRREADAVDRQLISCPALLHSHCVRIDGHHDRGNAEIVVDAFVYLLDALSLQVFCDTRIIVVLGNVMDGRLPAPS